MTDTRLADPGNFRPVATESTLSGLSVSGTIPPELNGALIRNGPNPQFPEPQTHWFLGDGMLHTFVLENGRARYRNRWVRTPKFLAERKAGHCLPSNGFAAAANERAPGPLPDTGTANTNIIRHAGRLLALEEGHLPMEVAHSTLEAIGYCDFGAALSGPFTAHPKVDPRTRELLFFGYNASGPFSKMLSFGSIGQDGKVDHLRTFEAPYSSMVHDFMVTENYVLFPILPLTGSMERARTGGPPYAWEPELSSWLGVLDRRNPGSEIRWFNSGPCYVFHVMNAWEEDAVLHADVMQYEQPPLFPRADGVKPESASGARLCRWTVSPDGEATTFARRYTDVVAGEFPRIDDRFAGIKNRHGWYVSTGGAAAAGNGNGLVHVDHRNDSRIVHLVRDGDSVSEPVFVPRSADAPEGDGWLLAIVTRGAEQRSDLEIFAATDLASGPVATIHLPCRVPAGFHGNWISAA